MLNVYSRCCHFFVDDWEIRENYSKEIKRIGNKYEENVEKWEIDYSDLNKDFPLRVPEELVIDYVMNSIKESTTKVIFDPLKKYLSKKRKSCVKKILPEAEEEIFSIQDPKNPSFKLPLLDYIAKNANSKLIIKLYSISKWFYFRSKIALCHRFSVTDTQKTISFEASLFISSNDLCHRGLKNIYITNALIVVSDNPFSLSKVMPIIYKSDPIYIDIKNQVITFEDYCLLVSGGNIEDVSFENVIVTKKNLNPVTVDYLIGKLPKVKTLKFGPGTVIDRFSSRRLGNIKLKTNLEHFEIHDLDESFEVFGFMDFVKHNTTPTTRFFLHFKDGTDETVKSHFRNGLFFLTIDISGLFQVCHSIYVF